MKKIILIIAGALIAVVGYSQSNAKSPAIKMLTVEEANRLNGVAQPTINGIPYSQYKAQQDALKQSNVQQKQIQVNNNLNATPVQPGTNRTSAPVNLPAAQPLKHDVDATSTVNTSKTNATPDSKVVVPSPAMQTIPAGAFKSSPLTPTPVGETPVTSKVSVTAPTNGGPAVALPILNVAVDNGNSEAKQINATPSTVQQTITEAKAAQIQEVPNSAPNPALKLPVVPNQTSEKNSKRN